MSTFTNLRKMFHVENIANEFTLAGEAQFNEANNIITSFNGTIVKDNINAYFNYNEDASGNVNYSINNIPKDQRSIAEALLNATVTDIHTQYDVLTA